MAHVRVSVVAAVFNGAQDVEAACRSVLEQSFADLELVVVDDASTDETPVILERLAAQDARIHVVRNDRQCGQTPSLNRGLRLSRGALIARIDADDTFLPGKLARQVDFLARHPEATVVGTWALRVTETGASVGVFKAPTDPAEIAHRLLFTSPICHVSVVMRRDAVLGVGGYCNAYRYAADFKLWSDLRRAGCTLVNLPEVLVHYRVASSTFGGASRFAAADEAAEIIRENARSLADLDLGLPICRGIALKATEGAPLSDPQRRLIFRAMDALTRRHYGRVPWQVRRRLFFEAAWCFSIGQREAVAPCEAPAEDEALPVRGSWLVIAEWLGRCSGHLGLGRLARLQRLVRRQTPLA
jgi:glycosyltransferase involved in cell wall biosynthesis